MADIQYPKPVILFFGLLVAEQKVLREVFERLESLYGPLAERTDFVPFSHSDYYREEMGGNLLRGFVAFEAFISPDELPGIKCQTNDLERAFCLQGNRKVNLDPGYVDMAKSVLASAKDYAHRIYLQRGIYAEIALRWQRGKGFGPLPWTYPDYQSEHALNFFNSLRKRLTQHAR